MGIESNQSGDQSLFSGVRNTQKTYERMPLRRVRLEKSTQSLDGCVDFEYLALTLGHADLGAQLQRDGLFDIDGLPFLHYLAKNVFRLVADAGGPPRVAVTPYGQSCLADAYPPTADAVLGNGCTMQ